MIPKIIHYCWFGRNPLPTSALKCIDSWRKYLPDYEIREWNEDNFDVNIILYTRHAYEAKKYAFVSDYARFWILYNYGGLYFDSDVEVIKPFDDIVSNGSFMGMEIDGIKNGSPIAINPGLGIGAEKGHPFYAKVLKGYEQLDFYLSDGKRNGYTMIPMITDMLVEKGLLANGKLQRVEDIAIYPSCFFNPYNSITGELSLSEETHSIHWYSASWGGSPKYLIQFKRLIRRIIAKLR